MKSVFNIWNNKLQSTGLKQAWQPEMVILVVILAEWSNYQMVINM